MRNRVSRKERKVLQKLILEKQLQGSNVSNNSTPVSEKDKTGLGILVGQDEIPEQHVLATLNLNAGDSKQGQRLPQIGSIRKLIIRIDLSNARIEGGTSNQFTSRAKDLVLKSFKITFND